jgi:hypothetical protein
MSLVQVATETVTSSTASVTLTGIDSDDVYMVAMNNVTPTADTNFEMRVLASSSVQSTANYDRAYKALRTDTTFSNSNSSNQTSNLINGGSNVGTGTGEQFNCIQYLYNFNNSSEYSFFTNETSFLNGDTALFGVQGGGVYTVAEAHNGVNYFFTTGDIEAGTFTLYRVV